MERILGRETNQRVVALTALEDTAAKKIENAKSALIKPGVRGVRLPRTLSEKEAGEPRVVVEEPLDSAEELDRRAKIEEEIRTQNEVLTRTREEIARRRRPPLDHEISSTPLQLADSEWVFELDEEVALLAAVSRLCASKRTLGPRSIRAVVFRYQLARLLLKELNVPCSAEQVVSELVRAITGAEESGAVDAQNRVRQIVEQVS